MNTQQELAERLDAIRTTDPHHVKMYPLDP